MPTKPKGKVVSLWADDAVAHEPERHASAPANSLIDRPRKFPVVTTPPRLPAMIPDEILDYYGWVFCQGGFVNLHMTFEQFLTVIATISPSGLCPEYASDREIASAD